MKEIIYLDNAATTKVDGLAFEKALSFTSENFYNPSALYRKGREASKKLDEARAVLESKTFGKKVVFTSCGTESDNTAIFGFAKRGNAVTTLGEHSAVYNSFSKLKEKGIETRFATLDNGGGVNVDNLLSKIDGNTSFVSVVHVNNETGAINDINYIAKKVKEIAPRAIFHSDGVQAFGKLDYTLSADVDLYSASAHKIGGLKGTGALFVNNSVHVQPYIIGGGQEGGLRSGTENVLGELCFANAYSNRLEKIGETYEKVKNLKNLLLTSIDKKLFRIISTDNASPFVVSMSAIGLRGAVLQNMLDDEGIIIGTGSACSSKNPHSRVLSAFEKDKKVLDGAIRISFSYDTDEQDLKFAVERLNFNASKLNGNMN